MANNYSTWKWTKKLFFHLFNLAVLNSYILLSSCGGKKLPHKNFWVALLSNMLEVAGQEQQLQRTVRRPPNTSVNIGRLENSFNKHWPGPFKPGSCCVCSTRSVTQKVQVKSLPCNKALCMDKMCFVDYYTKKKLYNFFTSNLQTQIWSLEPKCK
jgi:hypothetical protein